MRNTTVIESDGREVPFTDWALRQIERLEIKKRAAITKEQRKAVEADMRKFLAVCELMNVRPTGPDGKRKSNPHIETAMMYEESLRLRKQSNLPAGVEIR